MCFCHGRFFGHKTEKPTRRQRRKTKHNAEEMQTKMYRNEYNDSGLNEAREKNNEICVQT